MANVIGTDSIVRRVIGILSLDDRVYEEIEADTSGTPQAALVVVLAGILWGIGVVNEAWYAFLVIPIAFLIGWALASYVIYLVGTRLIPSPNTKADLGQVLRLIGFATAPAALGVLHFIPLVGEILVFIAFLLAMVVFVKAIMHALEMDIVQAIGTAFGALLLEGMILVGVALVFGIGFAIF